MDPRKALRNLSDRPQPFAPAMRSISTISVNPATVVVRGIGVRALLQQERNEVVATVPGRQDQRRGACSVLAVGIGTRTD